MEENFRITEIRSGVFIQYFNGKPFRLQKGERYFNNGAKKMHVFVWEYHNGQKVPKGFHIHHIDGNSKNNRIENLELVEGKKHLSEHAKSRVKKNPEFFKDFQKKGIAKAPEWHKSPEGIEWHKEHAKKCNFGTFDYGIKKCEECDGEYSAKTKYQRFCHNNCKAKSNRRDRKNREQGL